MRSLESILIVLVFESALAADIQLKNGWIKPNAWRKIGDIKEDSLESSGAHECTCLFNTKNDLNIENTESVTIFYNKILKLLFDRKHFVKDTEEDDNLIRAILFKIEEKEFNLIEKSTDPRDWDEFVTKVFKNANSLDIRNQEFVTIQDPNFFDGIYNHSRSLFYNIFFSYFELNVFTVSICLIVSILILHKRFNYNIIALIILAMFIIGYFNEYKQCNIDIEIEKVVSLLDNDTVNPCDNINEKAVSNLWFNFWSKSPKKEECAEFLRKQRKKMDDVSFCTPDDVFLKYVTTNICLKPFEIMIRKLTEIFEKIMSEISFPLNLVAAAIYCLTICQFLNLFFKYVIAPMINHIPHLRNNESEPFLNLQTQAQNHHNNYHELLRLQNDSINQLAKALTTQPSISIGSRVQILEKDENVPKAITSSLSNSTVTLEDINDDCPEINENKIKKTCINNKVEHTAVIQNIENETDTKEKKL